MAIAKVVLDNVTLMDTTGVTVTADTLAEGITALGNDGELITGTGGGFSYDDVASGTTPSNAVLTKSTINSYIFAGFTGLTSLSSNTVTTIKEYAFHGCTNLTNVFLPALTKLQNGTGTNTNTNGYFFDSCGKIASFYAPNLEYVYGNYAFYGTGTSSCVWVFPKLKTGSQRLFASSQSALFDLGPDLASLLTDAFYRGNSSKTLILRRTAGVVSAASADTISTIRTIYVPSDLVSSYQTASNWSAKYSAGTLDILPIENSIYETQYADGTPIPAT